MHGRSRVIQRHAYSTAEDQEGAVVKALGRSTAGNIPGGWENAILPRRPYLINVHCWLLGENKGDSVQLAALTYGCERGMHNLLRIKGATSGKSGAPRWQEHPCCVRAARRKGHD